MTNPFGYFKAPPARGQTRKRRGGGRAPKGGTARLTRQFGASVAAVIRPENLHDDGVRGPAAHHTVVKAIAEALRLRPCHGFGDDCRSQIDAENRGGAVLCYEQAIVSANTSAEIETLATGKVDPPYFAELLDLPFIAVMPRSTSPAKIEGDRTLRRALPFRGQRGADL